MTSAPFSPLAVLRACCVTPAPFAPFAPFDDVRTSGGDGMSRRDASEASNTTPTGWGRHLDPANRCRPPGSRRRRAVVSVGKVKKEAKA